MDRAMFQLIQRKLAALPLWVRVGLAVALYVGWTHVAAHIGHHSDYLTATLVLVNNGEGRLLNNFFNKVAPQDKTMFLWKNNVTPAETDVIGTYTKSTFTGYADKNLAASAWTVTEGAPSNAAAAAQTFTSSADQTAESAYGYGFQETTSLILCWVERFTGAPYTIQNNGDNIQITPNFTAD